MTNEPRRSGRDGSRRNEPSDTDVVVVGSGAAGMTAGITAALMGCNVVLIEMADDIGGTTALSGGAAWIPANPHMADMGMTDSVQSASTYIRHLLGNRFDPVMVGKFLREGPQMVSFLEARTSSVRFQSYPSPDYHPDVEGAASKARSLMAAPFDGRLLDSALRKMRGPMRELTVFGGMQVDPAEALHLQYSWKRWTSFTAAARLIGRYTSDRLRFGRGTRLIRGQALTARLLKSALDAGVDIRTGTTAIRLVKNRERITGIVVETEGVEREISTRRGIVLATGGFSANAELLAQHIPCAGQHITMMPWTNRGTGLRMAQQVGAELCGDNADNAIWMPASCHRLRDGTIARYPHFAFDRCKPGSIIVDATGKRFVNEASSYHMVVRAMHKRGAVPAWLIGDHVFVRKYGMGLARPFPYPYRHFVKRGYLVESDTITGLANRVGIDASALETTVARMNEFAERGVDDDFGKGGDIFTRMLGDSEHKPNPCLGLIRNAPFYALALYPSDCGTTLGLATNENAQVLRASGEAIAGLYACGLDMNSVMRGNYPGAGTMIGPAMTFGYIAGRHVSARHTEVADSIPETEISR